VAPRVVQHPGTRPTEHEGSAVDTNILRNTAGEVATPDETPHACLGGFVFLGFEGEDEHGEVIERVPCRRCNTENL
jgi:hypothetical protein